MPNTATAAAIGTLLRRVRLNDARTLDAVAHAIGHSEHSVARFEHGAEFTVTVFLRWCAALELAPSEVIRAAGELALPGRFVPTSVRSVFGGDS